MRKIISFLIIVAISLQPVVSASATETYNYSIDPELGEILVNSFDPEERKMIQNKDIYYWNAMDLEISDQPIVKVYLTSVFREWADRPYKELIAEAEKLLKNGTIIGCDYIIFDQEPIIIHYGYMGGDYDRYVIDIPGILPTDPTLMIQKNIQSLSANMEILGQHCKINNIVAFCGDVMSEQFLYLDTDKGVFVKYFDYVENLDGVWYSEETIREMGRDYLKELAEIPNGGRNLYGGGISSSDSMDAYTEQTHVPNTDPVDEEKNVSDYAWVIVASAVLSLGGIMILLIIIRKIKKRQ
jgi:hypothetical protein